MDRSTERPRAIRGTRIRIRLAGALILGSSTLTLLSPTASPRIATAESAMRNTIAAGGLHSMAMLSDGTVLTFGYNNQGQLGRTSANPAYDPTPTQASGLSGAIAVASGFEFSLVLRSDGTVWAFGSNCCGELGTTANMSTGQPNPIPTQVPGLSGVISIAAGGSHSLALRSDGTVWGFGAPFSGQLGKAGDYPNPTPAQVPGLSGVVAIAAGFSHSLVLRSDGTIWAFGDNRYGQLGTATNNGTSSPNPTPTQVPGVSGVVAIAAGDHHSLLLRPDGTVWSFGENLRGHLGTTTNIGTQLPNPTPTPVPGLSGVTALAAGNSHSLVLRSDGTVWAFGSNGGGRLGIAGAPATNPTPAQVPGLSRVTAIAAGGAHSLALLSNGTLWSFGRNEVGQLGTTSNVGTETPNPPTQIPGLGGVAQPDVAFAPLVARDFVSLVPGRLLDSRAGASTVDGEFSQIGVRPAGSVTYLTVAGRVGVPVDAAAVVLNVAVTDPRVSGFVTVWPCGTPMPTASSLNYTAGQTIPNAVTAKVGADGNVCLYTLAGTDLVVDIGGFFPAESSFVALTPARLLDSRAAAGTVDGRFSGIGSRPAGSVTELSVAGRNSVPADAKAVVLNVAVTDPQGPGYVTVWPCGTPMPTASNVNYTVGQTIPNAVTAKVGVDGDVCLFTLAASDLVVDLGGYYPAVSPFVALTPARLLDSRAGGETVDGQFSGIGPRAGGSVTELKIAGRDGVPMDAASVVLNLTVTEARGAGFVTVWPCGTSMPTASNLNYTALLTIANAVTAKIGVDGKVCVYTSAAIDLVADIDGYHPA